MDINFYVAIVSGVFAVLAAIIALVGQVRLKKVEASLRRTEEAEARKISAKQLVSRYRDPLLHAAFDLQSRIYNILVQGLVEVYYQNGNAREKKYVIRNTAFLIAQYFGWIEIIRKEIQFLDLGDDKLAKQLNSLLDEISNQWLRDDFGPTLRIFRGDQRGIGEQMVEDGAGASMCIGYAAFNSSLEAGSSSFLSELEIDILAFLSKPSSGAVRLQAIQVALIDLLDLLDPLAHRLPADKRTKVLRDR